MPSATSKVTLKWLTRCQDFVDEWKEYQSTSERLWRSLSVLEGQMETVQSFVGPLHGGPCGDLEWRNPHTTHPLVLECPYLPSRLLKRQMETREKLLRQLRQALLSVETKALKGLKALTKDVLAKCSTTINFGNSAKYDTVVDISYLEAMDWIDALSSSIHDEWAVHRELIDSYIHHLAGSEEILSRWTSGDLYDRRIEMEMRDRVTICRAMADKIHES